MPTIHVVNEPLGRSPSPRLLAECRRVASEPGAALWLSSSGRAAKEVRMRLAAGPRPVLRPLVYSFPGFVAAVAGPRPGTARPTRCLLEEVATDLSRRGQIPFFGRVAGTRGFLDAAVAMVEELDALGATPRELRLADGGPRTDKLTACAELYAAVVERRGVEWPMRTALARLADGLPEPFTSVRVVCLDGFASFTPAEWRLIETLCTGRELWVSLPEVPGERPAAFESLSEARGRFSELGEVSTEAAAAVDRPPALSHLTRNLFAASAEPTADATGLHLIEAPGPVGEARLVARRIRTLLADGVQPDAIVVTARDLAYSSDLLAEVFDEYGLPTEVEGDDTALRNPAVATLLRALRLADDGWPFAGVTALLRSTYFRPDWPEAAGDMARRAESLLRLLGEPRDREAYLRAVRVWAETPPDGLEDEQAEESRRLRKARLAAECRPFVERFFRAWDLLPASADPPKFSASVRSLATDLGIASADVQQDRRALAALWEVLARWNGPAIPRAVFLRRLGTLAGSVEVARPQPSAGRVRVVPSDEARHLDCDYLFILGLGERSFPRLGPPPSLLDDLDRQLLRVAGLPFPDSARRLGDEQLLFLQLIARPQRGLVLSYPAIDEKGQALLPGSFLRAVQECFTPDALKPQQQRMLIEGYLTQQPLSPAEARSRFAAQAGDIAARPDLPPDLCEHLAWARQAATARFGSSDFNRYDGWLDHPAALAAVRERFGPGRVFSPTALESFVYCPFRFLLEQVLRLEELDEPGEEVEHTRRGAAYHRALARLHARLGPDVAGQTLPETVGSELLAEIDRAVDEYAQRAPSPASKKLWELEGKRLHRSVARYRDHWEDYVAPWRKAGTPLSPRLLEADFGLPSNAAPVQTAAGSSGIPPLVISVNGIEVQIGGRIDRVDVAELDDGLGFWVIDYKTGRSSSYTAADLSRFEKLQLPLYALAVERVFYPNRKARPLGLAYWLVTDKGPKPVLPNRQGLGWLTDRKQWDKFRKQLEEWVAKVVGRIRDGQFPLAPRSEHCTDKCGFGPVCRIAQSRNVGKVWEMTPPAGSADGE